MRQQERCASGLNGFALSREFQDRLLDGLKGQDISAAHSDLILHLFQREIEEYCDQHVKPHPFKEVFMVNQNVFSQA